MLVLNLLPLGGPCQLQIAQALAAITLLRQIPSGTGEDMIVVSFRDQGNLGLSSAQ